MIVEYDKEWFKTNHFQDCNDVNTDDPLSEFKEEELLELWEEQKQNELT